MNNSKDIEKYGDVDKTGVPEKKYPTKREKKCFFGLLSLRSGLLITCAASVVSLMLVYKTFSQSNVSYLILRYFLL